MGQTMNLKTETYRGIKVGMEVIVHYPAEFAGRQGVVMAVNVEFCGMCVLNYDDGTTGRHLDINLKRNYQSELERGLKP